uniref:Biopolymer transport protein n=1 Tax=uncultured planctomycete 3FN TaxID=455066 RepID=A9LGW8_9BACT|nr:biopolymer transport protein [uncultured planctomycete 3FN]
MPLKINESAEESAINLTPMIDIVFLLIIFFMVGTQFTQQENQFEIKLPSVEAAQPLTTLPDEIVVMVSRDGAVLLDGKSTSLPELETRLKQAKKNYADQAVVVRGDGQGVYQHVMDVMGVCHRAAITHINLPAQLKREEQP